MILDIYNKRYSKLGSDDKNVKALFFMGRLIFFTFAHAATFDKPWQQKTVDDLVVFISSVDGEEGWIHLGINRYFDG